MSLVDYSAFCACPRKMAWTLWRILRHRHLMTETFLNGNLSVGIGNAGFATASPERSNWYSCGTPVALLWHYGLPWCSVDRYMLVATPRPLAPGSRSCASRAQNHWNYENHILSPNHSMNLRGNLWFPRSDTSHGMAYQSFLFFFDMFATPRIQHGQHIQHKMASPQSRKLDW